MQSGAFLSHGDAAGNLKVFSNRTFILFYKVLIDPVDVVSMVLLEITACCLCCEIVKF